MAAGPRVLKVPDGDNRLRKTCPECGFIEYENPKVVVGSVVTKDGRVLLCRRAIDPRKGFWTLPAGYMELQETAEAGARREAQEEAGCAIAIDGVLAIYSIPRLSQVQIIFRARLASEFAAGPESLEVALFGWDEVPWSDLAFPSVHWALRHWREGSDSGDWTTRANPLPEGGL